MRVCVFQYTSGVLPPWPDPKSAYSLPNSSGSMHASLLGKARRSRTQWWSATPAQAHYRSRSPHSPLTFMASLQGPHRISVAPSHRMEAKARGCQRQRNGNEADQTPGNIGSCGSPGSQQGGRERLRCLNGSTVGGCSCRGRFRPGNTGVEHSAMRLWNGWKRSGSALCEYGQNGGESTRVAMGLRRCNARNPTNAEEPPTLAMPSSAECRYPRRRRRRHRPIPRGQAIVSGVLSSLRHRKLAREVDQAFLDPPVELCRPLDHQAVVVLRTPGSRWMWRLSKPNSATLSACTRAITS
jgi:hypothetical protein